MSCAVLCCGRRRKSGSGWPCAERPDRSWASRSGTGAKRPAGSCGLRFPKPIDGVTATVTSGEPMAASFLPISTLPVGRRPGGPPMSSGSTTPFANGWAAWSERRSPSQSLTRCMKPASSSFSIATTGRRLGAGFYVIPLPRATTTIVSTLQREKDQVSG